MVSLPTDIPVGKSEPPLSLLPLLYKYMHREKEKCVLKQMCAYKTMNYNVLSLHTSFFTLFHPYQSNDNVNTKQTRFKWRASGFSFVKKLLQLLTTEIDILCKVKFFKHVLSLNGT